MSTDFSKQPAPHFGAPASAGSSYGKYFLVRKLAEGGMAEIFLAKALGAEGFERNVVIKRMLAHLSEVPDFVGMFLDEARLAARLSHPNVVQIHDLGLADGCYYICMEYLGGEDFSTLLRTAAKQRQYVPFAIAAQVVLDAATGLHFAHEFTDESGVRLNIVHRDISPSNIYVTYQGQVKVLDFGIAKAETRITQTSAGVVKGKYMYMAPEQARGEPVDRRADVFSLGVSLYEAVTLTRPFAKENDLAILNAVLRNEFIMPSKLRTDLPPELEQVILRAMAGKAEDRYPTAAAMAADLHQFLGASSSGGHVLGSYLSTLFGEERKASKTRIPSLAALLPRDPTPKEPISSSSTTGPITNVETLSLSLPPTTAQRPKSLLRRRRLALGLAGGGVLLALLASAYVFRGAWRPLLPGRAVEAKAPVVTPAQPAPVPLPSPTILAPPAPKVSPSVPAVTAPVPAPVPAPAPAVDTVRRRPVRLQQLDVKDVEKVVSGGRASIQRCFETYRQQLPSSSTELQVHLTIYGSGRVAAETLGSFKGTPVGGCVEERVRRLRFPAHKDQEVSFVLPLAFHAAAVAP